MSERIMTHFQNSWGSMPPDPIPPSQFSTDRLNELITFLEEEPKRFNMRYWGASIDPETMVTYRSQALQNQPFLDQFRNQNGQEIAYCFVNTVIRQAPPCGTMLCLAGAAVILSRGKKFPLLGKNMVFIFDDDTADEAAEWLKLSDTDCLRLFFLPYWPHQFKNGNWNFEPGTPEYLANGVQRIRHFQRTGE